MLFRCVIASCSLLPAHGKFRGLVRKQLHNACIPCSQITKVCSASGNSFSTSVRGRERTSANVATPDGDFWMTSSKLLITFATDYCLMEAPFSSSCKYSSVAVKPQHALDKKRKDQTLSCSTPFFPEASSRRICRLNSTLHHRDRSRTDLGRRTCPALRSSAEVSCCSCRRRGSAGARRFVRSHNLSDFAAAHRR